MPAFDLRNALNAISDVVHNRPKALREFDQIYMKSADMLLQTEHVSAHLDGKRVIFIGDGDAIGLCLVHLKRQGHLSSGPDSVHILDFDERVVNSVRRFAEAWKISDRVSAELYNVAEPLPAKHWKKFDGFYTNPPFGQRNDGASVLAFIQRGLEASSGPKCVGCVAIADDPDLPWTQIALTKAQQYILENGYLVSEFLPKFHCYHLDDAPELRSCSMIIRGLDSPRSAYASMLLPVHTRRNFYGKDKPLEVRYVLDHSAMGEDLFQSYTLDKYAFDQLDLNI